jgi:type VI secretion system protein ImpA
MPSPSVLDIESLLRPISGDRPAGEDLREDGSANSVYYQLKDLRSAARAAERAEEADGQEGVSQVKPEWKAILSLGTSVLSERSKDFEVVAWLIEALARVHGFAGIRDGYCLVKAFAETFWDGLYPGLEDGTYEDRIAPLTGLNGQGNDGALIAPLRMVPLTAGTGNNFALWHFQQANSQTKASDGSRRRDEDSGSASLDQIQKSARETPTRFYVDLNEDLIGAKDAFMEAMAALAERAGEDAPPDTNIRNVLDNALSAVRFLAGGRLSTEPAEAPAAAPTAAETPSVARSAGGAITSRESAFQELRRVADFFRATEPQSVISYALDEIVRRGQMSLQELIGELIPNAEARSLFLLSAGIKPPES